MRGGPRAQGRGITGALTDLYDVFVDWSGRLAREMPGIEAHLRDVDARRVLDVGCGTGRHVQALRERGFEAWGADVSDDMLAQARELLGGGEALVRWRLGDPAPEALRAAAPFDAVTCMGNVWPQVLSDGALARTGEALLDLLRPGGLLLAGLKAIAVRVESGDPYMPLLKRQHAGQPLWFVRFVDLGVPPLPGGEAVCDFHMLVASGDPTTAPDGEADALVHRVSRMRVWSAEGLAGWLAEAGFVDVRVGGRLDDPGAPVRGEDLFFAARKPAQSRVAGYR